MNYRLLFLVALAGCQPRPPDNEQRNEQPAAVRPTGDAGFVALPEIWEQWADQPIRCRARWLGKTVRIRGEVEVIAVDPARADLTDASSPPQGEKCFRHRPTPSRPPFISPSARPP
jgi:hypothetical protein